MGFDLEQMFNELIEIIDSEDLNKKKKLKKLSAYIVSMQDYAIQCGAIQPRVMSGDSDANTQIPAG